MTTKLKVAKLMLTTLLLVSTIQAGEVQIPNRRIEAEAGTNTTQKPAEMMGTFIAQLALLLKRVI